MLPLLYASGVHLTMSTNGKETASLYQGGSAFSKTPDPMGQDGTPLWGSWASKVQGGGLSRGIQPLGPLHRATLLPLPCSTGRERGSQS